MDKMKLAHDAALAMINSGCSLHTAIADAWSYADAMQAEAEKRKQQEQNKLKQDQQNHHDELVSIGLEEWQPDWSQAPEWANWWAMDGFSNKANWYKTEPFLDDDADEDSDEWNIVLNNSCAYKEAPSFNYQGNWKDSLRERPHGF